jgi:sterol desaturase/sphingolipid hydroxylase (fatty acid hydroxylase superfamily)
MPAALVGVLGSWFFQRDIGQWLKMDGATASLLLLILAVSVAEKLMPAVDGWNYNLVTSPDTGWAELGRDLLYFFGVTQLSVLGVKAADAGLRHVLAGAPVIQGWPSAWPPSARLLLAFLCIELLNYAYHRAAHAVPLLWQFHSTHHAVTGLVGIKALRTHPVDNVAFHVIRTAPLLLLGATAEDLSGALYLGGCLGILAHANVETTPLPGLDWWVNYPRFHAVHHSESEADSRTNYGCHTVLFDRLFGTFHGGHPSPTKLGLSGGARTAWQELGWPLYRDVRLPPRPGISDGTGLAPPQG